MQDSASTEPSTSDQPSADVILNRVNVALARSQRLINSWLPPAPPAESSTPKDDDDDDEVLNEVGGIGSKAARDDVDVLGLPRRKHNTNDKLLEQILGKKGAEAKRRKDAKEGKGVSGQGKAVPLVEKPKQQEKKRGIESDSEGEGGRASAFKSRKIRSVEVVKEARPGPGSTLVDHPSDDEISEGIMTSHPKAKPAKKKTASYLDEVLANKSKKKEKKKKSKGGQQNG